MPDDQPLTHKLVRAFLESNLSVLMIVMSLLAGAAALWVTPREEEPQIVVPVADVLVQIPGADAKTVEQLVSARLEKLLYQIDGVEDVYSVSRPGMAVVTVRFFVGESLEGSLIKLYNQLFSNMDRVTPGIAGWVVKPLGIDDVPILSAALYSDRYSTHELYRVAEEAVHHLQRIPDAARITIHGGERRVLLVEPDTEKLAAYGLSLQQVAGAVQVSNVQMESGVLAKANRSFRVEAGALLGTLDAVRHLMVGVHEGRPVYLRDVAAIVDGPEEPASYTRLGFGAGPAAGDKAGLSFQAVTVAVAKKPGSNAVQVARDVQTQLEGLRGRVIPDDVSIRITRDYGETANEKVNSLVLSLALAVATVIGLLALTMSWREGLIVAIAVPITYSLTLLFNYLMGYTINRVTLFALILSLGLLVDDPIVGVENIARHLRRRRLPRDPAILAAMDEVMPPVLLSTLAVIVSFVPMFFITGMMGPYMAPMAVNVPVAVFFSTVVALTITPSLSRMFLRTEKSAAPATDAEEEVRGTATYRLYSRWVAPLIDSRERGRRLLWIVGGLFVISVGLAAAGWVPLKMLPFDNKNEIQVTVDMPEGSTLEHTDAVVRRIENNLRAIPEVTDFTSTVGTASPMDFNGLVRQYYRREGPTFADVRVNLIHHTRRQADSHALVLRMRQSMATLSEETGAVIKLVEMPPGPPVLATVVTEVYGAAHHEYATLVQAAKQIEARMREEPGMVDIDSTVEAHRDELFFRIDREKAGLHGIAADDIARTLRMALTGQALGTIHASSEKNELALTMRLPRDARSCVQRLETMAIKGKGGALVELGELGRFERRAHEQTIFRKNLRRVVYVTAEMAGRGPAYAVLNLGRHFKSHPLPEGIELDWRGEGEWKITVDVFRDLGLAFGAALLGIFVLLVYQTRSYVLPGVIMLSIPLTMIGVMPGFWLLNALVDRPVGGFANPVFFTATAMIGMIALSGIVVRNALVLIEFVRTAETRGVPLREALLQSGAVRMRPILLTAGTTMLGAWPITLDPIFSGLAWTLIFGLFVSTAFTLLVIPVVYNLLYGTKATERPTL